MSTPNKLCNFYANKPHVRCDIGQIFIWFRLYIGILKSTNINDFLKPIEDSLYIYNVSIIQVFVSCMSFNRTGGGDQIWGITILMDSRVRLVAAKAVIHARGKKINNSFAGNLPIWRIRETFIQASKPTCVCE